MNAGTIDSERQHVEQAVPDAEQLSGRLSQRWFHQDQESVRRQPILDQGCNSAAPFLDALLIAWEKFYPRATAPVIVAFDSLAREVTLRVGADSGVTTIDAARVLSAAPVSIFADFVHFTDAGSAVMADVIRPGVLHAAGLASCATDAPNAASRDSR